MATVREIYQYLDSVAPFELQMDFDNAGFLVGRGERCVEKAVVALDITDEVIEEAGKGRAQLIVSHHPLIFHPVKAVTDEDTVGRRLLTLAELGIAAICAHTNLDAVQGGVNDCLAGAVGLTGVEQLHQDGTDSLGRPYGIGRTGVLRQECTVSEFAETVRRALNAPGVRLMDAGRPVRRVAVGGGSCGSMLHDVLAAGCDTFLTADVKYDVFLEAKALGVNLLDAGHFSTENVVCQPLAERLRERFPEVEIVCSTALREVFSCV